MYEFIRGTIVEINPANIIIETGGIGYIANVSLNTYSKLNGKKEAKLCILCLKNNHKDCSNLFILKKSEFFFRVGPKLVLFQITGDF